MKSKTKSNYKNERTAQTGAQVARNFRVTDGDTSCEGRDRGQTLTISLLRLLCGSWLSSASLTATASLLFRASNLLAKTATNAAPPLTSESSTDSWSFSASLYTYLVPDSRDYLNPTFAADHGWLHLEARYNYEALETGSLWVGYNLNFGHTLVLDVTPMLGGVFGDLAGVAPGYELSLSWRRLSFSSQGEFVFDTGNSAGSYFYTWTEFSYSPVDWFRAGLAVQRTRLYHTSLDIQRGFLVGFNYKHMDFTAYVFNLGWTDPTLVFAVGVQF